MENADGFAAKAYMRRRKTYLTAVWHTITAMTAGIYLQKSENRSYRRCNAAQIVLHSETAIQNSAKATATVTATALKLGGSGVGSAHIVENCLAFEKLKLRIY